MDDDEADGKQSSTGGGASTSSTAAGEGKNKTRLLQWRQTIRRHHRSKCRRAHVRNVYEICRSFRVVVGEVVQEERHEAETAPVVVWEGIDCFSQGLQPS